MATTSALPQGLRTYLTTCSAEHADQIIQTLREHLRQNAGGQAPSAAPSMTAQTGSKVGKKQRNKKAKAKTKQEGATGGPKRPLNSWMAFRKYYSASLAPHTQKAISKILTTWWREDPFEAKWAILAKAYSILRGSREKEDAPLDTFFHLAAPLIGVIPPAQYRQMMGWQLIAAQEGEQDKMPQIIRVFVPNLDGFDVKYTTTNLSADDVVTYCTNTGYVQPLANSAQQTTVQGALTMAVQPSTAPALTVNTTQALATTTEYVDDAGISLSPWSFNLASGLQAAVAEPVAEPAGQKALRDATTTITAAGSYPYNNLFDPTSEFDMTFDPNEEVAGLADGGMYDAFDPSANTTVDEMLNIDWNQFVNEDGLT